MTKEIRSTPENSSSLVYSSGEESEAFVSSLFLLPRSSSDDDDKDSEDDSDEDEEVEEEADEDFVSPSSAGLELCCSKRPNPRF